MMDNSVLRSLFCSVVGLAVAFAVDAPKFDTPRGYYENPFTLTIAAPPGASLRYTRDGTWPSASHGQVAGASTSLSVSGSGVVRAVAIAAGGVSQVVTHSYLFAADVLSQKKNAKGIPNGSFAGGWGSTEMLPAVVAAHRPAIEASLQAIPTLVITSALDDFFHPDSGLMADPAFTGREYEKHIALEIIDPVTNAHFATECGLALVGNRSVLKEKKPFDLSFRSEYGPKLLQYPLLPGLNVQGIDRLRLRLGGTSVERSDTQYGQQWLDDLQIHSSGEGQHGRMVHVYFNTVYWGMYNACEMAVAGFCAEHINGDKDDWHVMRADRARDGDALDWQVFFGQEAWDTAERRAVGREYTDLQQFIDYMLLSAMFEFEFEIIPEHRFVRNSHTGVGFQAYPWDNDLVTFYYPIDNWMRVPATRFSGPFIPGDLAADPEAVQLVADRVHRHFFNNGTFTPAVLDATFRARLDEARDALRADEARWRQRWFTNPRNIDGEANKILNEFIPNRPGHVLQHLRNEGVYPSLAAPALSPFTASFTDSVAVQLSGPATIYYTLDGSDPRLPGGAVAASAQTTAGTTVNLDQTTIIRARCKNGGTWSALCEAVYRRQDDDLTALRPSELMYHPRNSAIPRPGGWRVRAMPLLASQFEGGALAATGIRAAIDENWSTASSPVPGDAGDKFRYLVDGYMIPDASGSAQLRLTYQGRCQFWVDGTLRVNANHTALATATVDLKVSSGEPLRLAILFSRQIAGAAARCCLEWSLDGVDRGLLAAPLVAYDNQRDDDFAFIELHNQSGGALDVSGSHLSDGIRFTFPADTVVQPDARVVIVANPRLFAQRYPDVKTDYYFAGGLAKGGERLAFADADGNELWSFAYDDASPWPQAADGTGPSLVHLGGALDDSANWRASAEIDGSPGLPGDVAGDGVVLINEALTHTDLPQVDAIELYNPGSSSATIGGWRLADNRDGVDAWTIPAGTSIAAGAYRVFDEDDFGRNFKLSSLGEEVWLLASTYAHGFEFGASRNGVSFGRHRISTGEDHFVAQVQNTLGSANAGPRVGPLVISEIMYHPSGDGVEFLEIVNISNATVSLSETSVGHPWRVKGIGFEFPPGSSISASGVLLLVGGSPEAFRSEYSIDPAVQIFGPFSGKLANGGEKLVIQEPDHAVEDKGDLVVPRIAIDVVDYDDKDPWPAAADGDGPSLERIDLTAYGNDPANWRLGPVGGSPGIYDGGAPPPPLQITGGPVAAPHPVTGTSTSLSATVEAEVPSAVSYSWSIVAAPPGAPAATFSVNNSPAAATPVLTFGAVGNYRLRLQVSDANGTDSVERDLSVARTPSSLSLTP